MKTYNRHKSVVRREINRIIEEHGYITPELMLEYASKKGHPLHPYFQWNEAQAAHQWRLTQAMQLLRSIKIAVEAPDGSPVTVREFVHIPSSALDSDCNDGDDDGKRGEYITISQAQNDPDAMHHILESARRDLIAFAAKYSAFSKLSGAVNDVRQIVGKIK